MVLVSRFQQSMVVLTCLLALPGISGCSSVCFKINATDVDCLSPGFRPPSRNALVPIDVAQLGQRQPKNYQLDAGDTLAVLLPGVNATPDTPVSFSDFPILNASGESGLPPATGLPVPVQEDGTIRLPLVKPIAVQGKTMQEATQAVEQAYREGGIIGSGDFFPVVSLLRARTYTVTVIREDTANDITNDNQRITQSEIIELPAYQNDVLNALVRTGGMPGLTAKPEVRVIHQPGYGAQFPETIIPENNDTETSTGFNAQLISAEMIDGRLSCNPNEQIIPLRVPAGTCIQLSPEQTILRDGDIVYVESRQAEVFYTGGMLPGGQHLLPRDYDVDIFEAMAIAGYSYGSTGNSGGNGLLSITGVVPTDLYIMRKTSDGCEITIRVDLEDAANDMCDRLVVQAGDKLLLRYSPKEEVTNFGMFTFFTFGIQQLFRQ